MLNPENTGPISQRYDMRVAGMINARMYSKTMDTSKCVDYVVPHVLRVFRLGRNLVGKPKPAHLAIFHARAR